MTERGKTIAGWLITAGFVIAGISSDGNAATSAAAPKLEQRQGSGNTAATPNGEAHRLYSRARDVWSVGTPAALERAEKLLNDAIVHDPKFALAYVGLADVWLVRAAQANETGEFGRGDAVFLPTIVAQIKKALELEPELAEAHVSLGNAYAAAWRFDEARPELETAIRLNPKLASAHHALARLKETDGRLEEALAGYRQAVELDPSSARIAEDFARALVLAGRPADAVASANRALALEPDNTSIRRWRAWALVELDRKPEAIEDARRLSRAAGPMDLIFASAVLYRTGLGAEADTAFRQIPATAKTSVQYLLAVSGRREVDVIAVMAPAIGRPADLPLLLYLPAFDPIRSHARFREIIREAGAGAAHTRAQTERNRWRAEAEQRAKGAEQGAKR
jgi:Tfp pilus assembly protein PilF